MTTDQESSSESNDEVTISVAWQPGMWQIDVGDLCTAYLEDGSQLHAIITEINRVEGGLVMKAIKDWTDDE